MKLRFSTAKENLTTKPTKSTKTFITSLPIFIFSFLLLARLITPSAAYLRTTKASMELADGQIATIAGSGNEGFSGDGGPATSASLRAPNDVAIDRAGNLFIADTENNRIRRIDANTGTITTVAGNGAQGFSGDGDLATNASLNNPTGVVVDSAGNLFIADSNNNRIRRVDAATGTITTVVGRGNFGFSGDGGPATSASLNLPVDLALDGAGNLFIADTFNNRIRKVNANGIISTVVGKGTEGFGGDGGPATGASLDVPEGLVLDGAGNLFIADTFNNRVRKMDAKTGIITTVAGNGMSGFSGDGGLATSAGLNVPEGLVLDIAGNLFIADTENNRIRKVDAKTGVITTVAGNGMSGFSGDGGPAISATLNSPEGLTIDVDGNLLIADTDNNVVRSVKGVAVAPPKITTASFAKPNLTINGTGFGSSGVNVSVNGRDVSARIISQSDTLITLKGSKKKLGLKSGPNQITVTVNGVMSNTFVLNLLIRGQESGIRDQKNRILIPDP